MLFPVMSRCPSSSAEPSISMPGEAVRRNQQRLACKNIDVMQRQLHLCHTTDLFEVSYLRHINACATKPLQPNQVKDNSSKPAPPSINVGCATGCPPDVTTTSSPSPPRAVPMVALKIVSLPAPPSNHVPDARPPVSVSLPSPPNRASPVSLL